MESQKVGSGLLITVAIVHTSQDICNKLKASLSHAMNAQFQRMTLLVMALSMYVIVLG